MIKPLIHYYKNPPCELRTLCGVFVHCAVGYKSGKLKKLHTTYKNRITCEECLKELNKH